MTFNGVWYVFGGDIGTTYIQDIEAFDPAGNNILQLSELNENSISNLNGKKPKRLDIFWKIQNCLLFPSSVGEWKIVGKLPLAMSDHCMIPLNNTHAVLNAGEWLGEGDAMTGDSYIFDSTSMKFTKGIILIALIPFSAIIIITLPVNTIKLEGYIYIFL